MHTHIFKLVIFFSYQRNHRNNPNPQELRYRLKREQSNGNGHGHGHDTERWIDNNGLGKRDFNWILNVDIQ